MTPHCSHSKVLLYSTDLKSSWLPSEKIGRGTMLLYVSDDILPNDNHHDRIIDEPGIGKEELFISPTMFMLK